MLIAASAALLASLINLSATAARSTSSFPEPGILVLLGTGLIGLATVIRRRFSE